MWGGYSGPGHKTIVPSDAYAKVSFRLVPDQRGPTSSRWCASSSRNPAGHHRDRALGERRRRPLVTRSTRPRWRRWSGRWRSPSARSVGFARGGGSGPRPTLAEILGAPVVFLGVGLPDDAVHSPNERVVLPMLGAERGRRRTSGPSSLHPGLTGAVVALGS
jgi:acetylornithine deacetylase/succinyl-diaminopimelate desuccinylase-like protein